jgi:hypothetical protein
MIQDGGGNPGFLELVHYERAVEGLGARRELVERAADITPALKRALASGRPPASTPSGPRRDRAAHSRDVQRRPFRPRKGKTQDRRRQQSETTLPYSGKRKLDRKENLAGRESWRCPGNELSTGSFGHFRAARAAYRRQSASPILNASVSSMSCFSHCI